MAAKTQADRRRPQKMTDQHGRPWYADVEKASGYPTGLVQAKFQVPHPSLMPPQKYLEFSTDNPARLTIDYARWKADSNKANQEYDESRIRLGRMLHQGAFDPKAPATMELAALLGPRPMPAEPIIAMEQGNLWALGLSSVKPPEAHRFFPDPPAESAGPVFSGPVFSEPTAESATAPSLATAITDIEARCPPELKGVARNAWIMRELKAAAQPALQEA